MITKNKDLNKLIKEAQRHGWVVIQTQGGHLKWLSPVGATMFSSYSPSDVNAVNRIKKDLKLNGFIELKRRGKNVKNKETS
jgi:hypothetical protein